MTKHPIRFWLSGHSVVYRLITYSNLGDIIRLKESKSKNQNSNSQFAYDKPPLHTVFTPEKRLSALNLDDGKVYEGLQLSLSYLDKINLFCLQNNINLIVLLIPTKEHVYNDLLSNIDVPATFKQLITNETSVDTLVKDSLKLKHINYIDVLPALTEAAYHEQIYPVNDDGHPNLNGYNVIARTVAQQLR